jgi:hypothetical protein
MICGDWGRRECGSPVLGQEMNQGYGRFTILMTQRTTSDKLCQCDRKFSDAYDTDPTFYGTVDVSGVGGRNGRFGTNRDFAADGLHLTLPGVVLVTAVGLLWPGLRARRALLLPAHVGELAQALAGLPAVPTSGVTVRRTSAGYLVSGGATAGGPAELAGHYTRKTATDNGVFAGYATNYASCNHDATSCVAKKSGLNRLTGIATRMRMCPPISATNARRITTRSRYPRPRQNLYNGSKPLHHKRSHSSGIRDLTNLIVTLLFSPRGRRTGCASPPAAWRRSFPPGG